MTGWTGWTGWTGLLGLAEPGELGTLDEVVLASAEYWPVLLAVPLVALLFGYAARQRRRAVEALGNPALISRLVGSVHHGRRLLVAVATTAAVAAVGVGLLRLQYGGTAEVIPASGLDVVLAVDYSKSMLAQDVYPSRSERLEAELGRFLDDAGRRGDRVGVVVFAGAARGFPVTPDMRLLKLYLADADPRFERPGGTAMGKALSRSLTFLVDARRGVDDQPAMGGEGARPSEDEAAALQDVPPAENGQAIVLLTDGEDNASRPLELAEEAARLGVRIYTVGIGSKSGEPIQTFDENGNPTGFVKDEETGQYRMTRLDESLLQEIAKVTGGRYVKVEAERFSLDEVRDVLEELSRTQREDTIEVHHDEGFGIPVVAGLALLCLALGLGDRREPA
ncbi:VWA domain-containing protein [Paraliomyxa miuraensis]|uniref:VWA domain-containing protein n=1 Tax=Paraliomyxa miuraensis TaxID=376150 RepID=UPI002259F010|nr:VWA domain-containing protein [Paraliomyxa miuraensis]MCX4246050.1 VWA domain-containing protein [Paraliomyxa miuraensis]